MRNYLSKRPKSFLQEATGKRHSRYFNLSVFQKGFEESDKLAAYLLGDFFENGATSWGTSAYQVILKYISLILSGTTCIRLGKFEAKLKSCPSSESVLNERYSGEGIELVEISKRKDLKIYKARDNSRIKCGEYPIGVRIEKSEENCFLQMYVGTTGHLGPRTYETKKKTERARAIILSRLNREIDTSIDVKVRATVLCGE